MAPSCITIHSHFQLVQGFTSLIAEREDASLPTGGQDGVTWTVLETHPNVMASVPGFPLSPGPSPQENCSPGGQDCSLLNALLDAYS